MLLRNTLPSLLSLVLVGNFIFSALTKLITLDAFSTELVVKGLANWENNTVLALGIITLELWLAIFITFSNGKKYYIIFSILLLVSFSVFLALSVLKGENTANCYCYGEVVALSPLKGIIKNLLLIVVAFLLLKYPIPKFKSQRLITFILILLSLGGVLTYHFSYEKSNQELPVKLKEPLNNELIKEVKEKTAVNLKQHKRILCFFSTTCPHCKTALKKLHHLTSAFKKKDLLIDLFLIGLKEQVPEFLAPTNYDYHFINQEIFFAQSGNVLPRILLTQNGVIQYRLSLKDLNGKVLKDFLETTF